MKLYFGAFAGVLLVYSLKAQEGGIPSNITDPVLAAEEAQRQAQFAYENQLSELNNSANIAKEELLARRNSLNRDIQQCFIQKNEAQIGAEQNAQQQTQQATNQLIQGSMQGVTPLLQNFGTANGIGKKEAEQQKRDALSAQSQAATQFLSSCGGSYGTDVKIDPEGRKASRIKLTAQNAMNGIGSDPSAHANTACRGAGVSLLSATQDAEEKIREEKQASAVSGSNTASMLGAAAMLGVNYYGYNQGKQGAEDGLQNANRINAMNYDSCQEGVKAEAAEIDRQIANIDRQLAFDRDRLAKQFAQFKLNMPSNVQNKTPLTVEDDEMPKLSALGGPVTGTTFKSPENPFGNLGKNGGGEAGGGGAAGGSAGAGGAGDDGKVGWGFRDPYETNNPGLAYTLPNQPEKAGLIGGADGGEMGGGANPFGDGFMGFEDPFGNLAGGAGGAALAEGQGGNGFIELALKTRRRVYAHLSELLGKPNGSKVSKDGTKNPERKISSVRD